MEGSWHGECVTEDNETFGKSFWKQSKKRNELYIWRNILTFLFLQRYSKISTCFHPSNFLWKEFVFLLQTQDSLLGLKINLVHKTSSSVERIWRQKFRIMFRTCEYIHVQTRKISKFIKVCARGSRGTPCVTYIENVTALSQLPTHQLFSAPCIFHLRADFGEHDISNSW